MTIKELKAKMIADNTKTLYVKKSTCDLSNANVPNAGPRPCISGMRKQYWGRNAIVAIQGQYAYKL